MTTTKRRALIISYVWPPMEGVGLIRAMKFAKYLPENGWEPIVLTIRSEAPEAAGASGMKVFRTGYRDVIEDIKGVFTRKNIASNNGLTGKKAREDGNKKRKAPSFIREMILMPDDQIGWYSFAVKEGKRIVKEESIDVIISTSPPETAHLVARSLKKFFNIPWVADLRDLWADDHFRERPLIKRLALRFMEKRVLKDADKVVTVSGPWARTLKNSLSAPDCKVEVIENGFDEEDFSGYVYGPNKKFTISYTGKLHEGKQPVGVFFEALRDLIRGGSIDRDRVEVRFYAMGYDKPDITGMALSYGLEDVVVELGKVSYMRSLEIQRASDALLFVQWQGKGGDGWYSAKLYDYIGSRRPILALASEDGIVADLISKTSSGVVVVDGAGLRAAILKLYDEYLKNGCIQYGGNEAEIVKNSRRVRARRLSELLDSVTRKREQDAPAER